MGVIIWGGLRREGVGVREKVDSLYIMTLFFSHRFGASAGLMVMAFLPRPRHPSSSE